MKVETKTSSIDVAAIREQFPILREEVNGKQIVYLDNGATSQKPLQVIEAIDRYYKTYNSNIHRGVHHLSQLATAAYEEARQKLQDFINAKHSHEVILTSGTTDSINMIAQCFGMMHLQPGDEIVISEMEHHSNIVPWQMIAEATGAKVKYFHITENGELNLGRWGDVVTQKTKLIALVHVSNSLGTINPAREIIEKAHEQGIPVLLDGAQAVPHMPVDVQELDCDFYAFSGHKMFGPTGTGVLYGKEKWLNELPPYRGGGEMIESVSMEKTTYNELPHKYEAGTPNIAGVIGLGTAVDYINEVGYDAIEAHEAELLQYATKKLTSTGGIRIIGTAAKKASVISFLVDGAHPYDIGTLLDQMGIAVRTGHHCTQPLMDCYGIPGTIRASFCFYNNKEDVDRLVEGVEKAKNMLTG